MFKTYLYQAQYPLYTPGRYLYKSQYCPNLNEYRIADLPGENCFNSEKASYLPIIKSFCVAAHPVFLQITCQ